MADTTDNEPKKDESVEITDAKHVTEMMGPTDVDDTAKSALGAAAVTSNSRSEAAVPPAPVGHSGDQSQSKAKTQPHRNISLLHTPKLALGAAAILLLGFGGGWLGAASRNDVSPPNVTKQTVLLKGQGEVVRDIAKNVGPSVVSVNVTGQSGGNSFYGLGGGETQSAGTGIILTADGLIMTNRHVVPVGTTNVSVTLSDGTVFENVKLVGRTSSRDSLDVAFLQVEDTQGKTLSPVTLGDSSAVKVGDPVVAIGNALGQFQNTVTSGIISGYGRSVQASSSDGSSSENLDDLFQTDAAINQGNSGGPLVNLDGHVIGMNTAVASDSQNIGFAIPVNDLSGLIDSVKKDGKLQRPYMGVIYLPVTNDVAKQYNLSVKQGAYIPTEEQAGGTTVIADGPADKAGVEPGDVITEVDGKAINQNTSLTSQLDKRKVGETVTLTIVRDGKTITKKVTLGSAPTDS